MTKPVYDVNRLQLGTIEDGEEPIAFATTEGVLETHMAIFGGTGQGKSKLFEHICRQLAMNGRGFAFIDPHSDTADDLMAYLACHFKDLGLRARDVVYLNPYDQSFSFDPFVYRPDPDDPSGQTEERYRSWLAAKISDMVKIILRKRGEPEEEQDRMVRLHRWLYNALYAVGVRQDENGTHLPMSDALVLLDPGHERHAELFASVEPHLDDDVRSDFRKLRQTKDVRKQEDWVESTVNTLRRVLRPITRRIFSLEAPSINFHEIIERNGIILASLGKQEGFHEEEGQVVAGLVIREISSALRTVPRDKRQQFYLFIDEAQNYLNEDLKELLRGSRKYKLSMGLAIQQLDNLRRGDVDLVPAVLGQCGIHITFQQKYEEDAMTLAKSMCYSMLDFTELLEEVDRDAGYDWFLVPSESHGETTGLTVQVSRAISESKGIALGQMRSTSNQLTISDGESQVETVSTAEQERISHGQTVTHGVSEGQSAEHTEGSTIGSTETEGHGDSSTSTHGTSANEGYSDTITSGLSGGGRGLRSSHSTATGTHGSRGRSASIANQSSKNYSLAKQDSRTVSDSVGESSQRSHSVSESTQVGHGRMKGRSIATGKTRSTAEAHGETSGKSVTQSVSSSESETSGVSRSVQASHSITMQLTPLRKTRTEVRKTGQFVTSISDQQTIHGHAIQSLRQQHCLISIGRFNSAFFLRIDDVFDAFSVKGLPPAVRSKAIGNLKELIYDKYPFYLPDRHDLEEDEPEPSRPKARPSHPFRE